MSNTTPDAILGVIRSAESESFDDYFRGSVISPPKPLTQMTVREVRAWQDQSVRKGSKSSAVGGYQIIRKTMDSLISDLGLTGDEVFDETMQNRMGMHLMNRRGYNDWVGGKITDTQFANNLSKEWAGLPMVSGPKTGASFYAGDGLNKSNTTPQAVFAALGASRNGQSYEAIVGQGGFTPSNGGASSAAPSQYQATLADLEALGGDDDDLVERISAAPVAAFRSIYHDMEMERQADEATPGFWEGAGMAIDEEWIGFNVMQQAGRPEFTPDRSDWATSELMEEVTEGLDPAYHNGLEGAVSPEHLRFLSEQLRNDQDVDRQLGSMGWGGVGLRLGAAILDPVAILATVATEGAAAPFIYGQKVGRVGRSLRAGVAGAAVNAGIDGYLSSQDATMGWDDVAISAAAGFVLGGTIGALRGNTAEDAQIVAALQDAEGDAIARQFGPQAANDGSFGAARVQQEPNLSPAEQVAEGAVGAPTTAMANARYDRAATFKSSESDLIRDFGGGLVEDAVGNADGSANRISVSERKTRADRVRLGRFYRTYNQAYREWLKDNGKRMFWQHGHQDRSEFNRMVTLGGRREIDAVQNKHVAKVVSQMKAEFSDMLQFGKQMGIRGFDEIKANNNYMVRRHRQDRLQALFDEFQPGQIHRLVAESIQSANRKRRNLTSGDKARIAEIDYEDALDMAKVYLKSIRSRRFSEFNVNRALAGADMDTLNEMLLDYGMAPDDIARISDKVRFTVDSGEKGRMENAKWRLDLDETWGQKLINKAGVERTVGIEDFLEDDAELLFGNYVNSVHAAGYMEDFMKQYRVPDAEGNLPAHAPSYATVRGYMEKDALSKGYDAKKIDRQLNLMNETVNLIHGRPIADTTRNVALRRLRDYNFSRIGGQLGVAQLAELGNVIGQGGLRVMMQNIPALRRIFANAKTGKFSDEFLNEIEAIWGFGTDLERMNMNVMFDDLGQAEVGGSTRWERLDHGLQRAKRFTVVGSGMGHVNMALQRLTARILVQRFMDDATGVRGINSSRMASMGIDPEMHARIQAQLSKHVDTTTGLLGKKVQRINIQKWDDQDAMNAFVMGVDRWSKKVIQENDIGNMPGFMSTELGKTIFQFRSFMLAAYTKQLLAGIHHRDWETFSAFATSMFFGGLFYVGQTYVNAIGREDAEEVLEDRLSPESIAKASFLRAGFSSVIPMGVDMSRGVVGLDPVFDFRSSGLKSGGVTPWELLSSNPTVDLIDGASRGIAGLAQGSFNPDYDFSQKDFRALTKVALFQNMFGIRNMISAIGGGLPQYSQ